ncbi:MAG TPA: lysozyme inhibitor LprI family protein [Rhizomicrobium sp.]|nr:lysozyme inhibitor LprI family protein [Rhizomicrobium sp.]
MGRSSIFVTVVIAFVAVLAAGVANFAAAATVHASFDCAKATRAIDKLICSDDGLAGLDVKVAAEYKAALAAGVIENDSLRAQQRAWLAKRDAECLSNSAPVVCLKQSYTKRYAQLYATLPLAQQALFSEQALATMPGGGTETVVITVPIVPLQDKALAQAHPAERREIGFPQGAFSPKGDLFAFAVDNIVSGDPDQIWLYRLADKKLIPATVSPVRGRSSITIDAFFFVDGTLYIDGSSGEAGGVMTPFKRAATMAGAHEVATIPKAPPTPNLARDTTAEAADELSNQGDKREEDAHYVVTSTNGGHGAITLSAHAKGGGPEWTIATGTWNLADFVFDAPRGRVLYGDETRGLVSYDLKTKKTSVEVPVAVGKLLDVTADGHFAAYSAYSFCNSHPGKTVPGAQVLCFASLP